MKLNNLSVLPFYDELAKQNHRRSYAYGNIYPYAFPINFVPPFQLAVGESAPNAISIKVHSMETETDTSIATELQSCGFFIAQINGTYVLCNNSKFALTSEFAEGRYYLIIKVNGETFYSEVFTWTDVSGRLKIEWYDNENLLTDDGVIIYKTHAQKYRNIVYLDTELGKPEYTFEEEGEKRDGYFFAEKQLSEKVYKFIFLAPEFLCDVMRTIRLTDHVIITDPYDRVFSCDTFLMTPKWQVQGDLASVECEFETNTVIKKIGKSVDALDIGAYNDDFDNSFDIED